MKKIVPLFLVLIVSMLFTESIFANSEKSNSDLSQLCSTGEGEILKTTTIAEKIVASFTMKEWHEELKTHQNPAVLDSLKTHVYLVREVENECPVVFVVVTKMVDQTDMVHAFGEMTIGEGCSHKDFFGDIDVKGKSPNNLAETIESNMDVSYAIKRWYFDYVLQKGR